MKFDLEDMRYFAEKHRGKYRTSGPYWSTIIRFPILFDEYEKMLDHAKAVETRVAELEAENDHLSKILHDKTAQFEIATDLSNKRWIALNEIYENGEKHNVNWCKRKAQEGLTK